MVDNVDIDQAGLLDQFEAGLGLEGFDEGWPGLFGLGLRIGWPTGLGLTLKLQIDIEPSGEACSIQYGDPVKATCGRPAFRDRPRSVPW